MNAELCQLLDQQGGVVTSAQALNFLTRRDLEMDLKCGVLEKVWYGIYGRGELTDALRLRGLDWRRGQLSRCAFAPRRRCTASTPNWTPTCMCSIPMGNSCDRPAVWLST